MRETPVWDLAWAHEGRTEVTGEDPLRLTTAVELDGDVLRVTVDGAVSVVETVRE